MLRSARSLALIVGLCVATVPPAANAALVDGEVLVQQGSALLPADPAARMVGDVSLSADGTTALVGGDAAANTAANRAAIFGLSQGAWTRQADLPGVASGTALSADGTTALVGSIFGGGGKSGDATVFVRSGASWVQQGPSFTPYGNSEGNAATWFGASAALSSSGDIAVVGAPEAGAQGGAWVYERREGAWAQAAYLGPPPNPRADQGYRGWDVAISGDGGVILVASRDRTLTYLRSPGGWVEGAAIAVAGSVSLSSDGRTALVGGVVFAWTGAEWANVAEIADSTTASTAMSGDASVAVGVVRGAAPVVPSGAQKVQVYTRRDTAWMPVGRQLDAGTGPGWSKERAALAHDGRTAIVGIAQGAAVFAPGAVVTAVSPASGSRGGGERVTITGEGFVGVRQVMFGPTRARRFDVRSPTRIEAVTPPTAAGAVHVAVAAGSAVPPPTTAARFRFLTPRLSLGAGGLRVRLKRPRVRISCLRSTCAGLASVTGPRGVTLARGSFSVNAGARRTIRLRITRSGRRATRQRLSRGRLVVEVRGMPTVRRTVSLR